MATRQGSFPAGSGGTAWQSGAHTSPAVDVSDLKDIVVVVVNAGDCTVAVDISMDGTNFAQWDAGTQDGSKVSATIPSCKMIQVRTSEWTSGTPVAGFSGTKA